MVNENHMSPGDMEAENEMDGYEKIYKYKQKKKKKIQ